MAKSINDTGKEPRTIRHETWTANVVAISLASFPAIVTAQIECEAIPNRLLSRLNSIGGNRILPLPERALNQAPLGIAQLREQTLQNIEPHRRR